MIECKKSTVSLIDDDILFINIGCDQEFCLHDYKEVRIASIRLASNKNVFNLINLGDKTIPNKEAREACSSETGNGCVKGEAIIVHSLGQRIVARHILKQKRGRIPVKLFTSLDKAQAWLKRLKNEQGIGLN